MNLIEKLGGYEKAKEALIAEQRSKNIDPVIYINGDEVLIDAIDDALLQYRRQHSIFEVGDRFVIDGLFGVFYANDGNIPYLDYNMIRHATDAEIEAGKRLGVNDGN